jgi:hypothetical protein
MGASSGHTTNLKQSIYDFQYICGLATSSVNKSDVIKGAGLLGKSDDTWGKANSTGMSPEQKVNKAE